MSFKLIKAADEQLNEQLQLSEHVINSFTDLAEEHETTVIELSESVTHVLARIAQTALAGEDLDMMHIDSIASFLSGVERIATLLPRAPDSPKKENTLRILRNAAMGNDGLVNHAVAPIAQVGVNDPEARQKYVDMLKAYTKSVDLGKPDGKAVAQAARRLQLTIDQAMRVAGSSQQGDQPEATPTMRQRLIQK